MPAVVLILLAAGSLACLGPPRRVRGPAPDFLRGEPERRVWATLTDGTNVVLEETQVVGDTVVAVSEGVLFVVPVDGVAEVKVKRISLIRTGVLVVGVGTVGVLLIAKGGSNDVPIDTSDFYQCRQLPNPILCM